MPSEAGLSRSLHQLDDITDHIDARPRELRSIAFPLRGPISSRSPRAGGVDENHLRIIAGLRTAKRARRAHELFGGSPIEHRSPDYRQALHSVEFARTRRDSCYKMERDIRTTGLAHRQMASTRLNIVQVSS